MNAHQVVASINQDTGGPAVSVTRLHQALTASGIYSQLHSIDYDRHGPVTDPDAGPFPRAGWATRTFRGWSPAFRARLDESLAATPGIVHNHGCWMTPNRDARVLAAKHQVPLIISPRGMLEQWAMQFHSLKKKLAWSVYEQRNLQAAAAFHATSVSEAESIRSLGFRQPIYLIPNGVDLPDDTQPATKPDSLPDELKSPFILFLSRLHQKKGLELLLHSWEQLHASHPDIQLVIAGPDRDDYRSELTRLYPDISQHSSVCWLGPVRGAAKAWLLSEALFMALPSYSENFGQVVAESLAHHTPVLTTDRTPWMDLHRRGCGWVIAPDQTQLTEAMKAALDTSQTDLTQMGQQGHQWMEQEFSWSRIGQCMQDAYRHIEGCGPTPDFLIAD